MTGRYKPYAEYKDSGVEWLDSVPNHWDVKKLKFLAYVQPSNVDKKTNENESPVLLCNYTDVYYNETVHADMDFMKATATEDQIAKFTLRSGDTIITKDSEDPNDIAIPTFVPENMPGVVCGYHLSIIRPLSSGYGLYIKRVFECGYARAYFATRSNGLTRYGLGTYALDNVFFPKPSEKEAENIAKFIDHETAKIDTLIEQQQQLIQLLKEKRQAVISHAVTKGLNPCAKMRDSGVQWLGDVPEHWEVLRVGWLCEYISYGFTNPMPSTDEGPYMLTATDIEFGRIKYEDARKTSELAFKTLLSDKSKPIQGDVLLTKDGTLGRVAFFNGEYDACISQSVALLRPNKEKVLPEFLSMALMGADYQRKMIFDAGGTTIKHIYISILAKMNFVVPEISEQAAILTSLNSTLRKIDYLINQAELASDLFFERRTALISAAVTGKIDLRNWVAQNDSQTNKEVAA